MQTLVELFGGAHGNYRHYRPSPFLSAAKASVGTVRIGHDKRKWIVIRTKYGIHRWIHLNTTSKTKPKSKRRSKKLSKRRKSPRRRRTSKKRGSAPARR